MIKLILIAVVIDFTFIKSAIVPFDDDPSNTHFIDPSCEYYNISCIQRAKYDSMLDVNTCYGKQKCNLEEEEFHGCSVVWIHNEKKFKDSNKSIKYDKHAHHSGHNVIFMGCFPQHSLDSCKLNDRCLAYSGISSTKHSCCCMTTMCNSNFSFVQDPSYEEANDETATNANGKETVNEHLNLYLAIGSLIFIFFLSGIIITWYCLSQRSKVESSSIDEDDDLVTNREEMEMHTNFSLERFDEIASGRFGTVWKGMMNDGMQDHEVAIKVFDGKNKPSWLSERKILRLLTKNHPNILRYHFSEIDNNILEYSIITEFHQNGSLYDFLTHHLVSWNDLCKIAEGICHGLSFLHLADLPSNKPIIAHRDVKSKNILIKSDLTASIADFGLAVAFGPESVVANVQSQVGTRRYMAPEVLGGAIDFSEEHFLRIDMYACGFVLWEMYSRCTAGWIQNFPNLQVSTHKVERNSEYDTYPKNSLEEITISEFKLPFEVFTGKGNPSLDQMIHLVIDQGKRPSFKEDWSESIGISSLQKTIQECWDDDPEARISASCVAERIQSIAAF